MKEEKEEVLNLGAGMAGILGTYTSLGWTLPYRHCHTVWVTGGVPDY